MKVKNRLFLLILSLVLTCSVYAQEGPSTWFELGFSKKLAKNLKFEFNPELRLRDAVLGDSVFVIQGDPDVLKMDSTYQLKMDSYILEGGLSYKLHKYLTVAGYYRFEEEYNSKYKRKKDAAGNNIKPKQYDYVSSRNSSNRLAFDLKSGFDLKRFGFQFRIRYTKGLYSNNNTSEFRYRAKVDYNIKNSKLLPFASIEAFHDNTILKHSRDSISGGFKTFDKIRYTGGLSYALNKNNEFTLFYRLQNNRFVGVENSRPGIMPKDLKEAKLNIIGLGYSHDF